MCFFRFDFIVNFVSHSGQLCLTPRWTAWIWTFKLDLLVASYSQMLQVYFTFRWMDCSWYCRACNDLNLLPGHFGHVNLDIFLKDHSEDCNIWSLSWLGLEPVVTCVLWVTWLWLPHNLKTKKILNESWEEHLFIAPTKMELQHWRLRSALSYCICKSILIFILCVVIK